MDLARSSPTVLTWFMDASARGLQRPHSGTPRPPGASTPSGPTRAVATLTRRLASLSVAHRMAGHHLDTRHPAIRDVMSGLRRARGTAQRRARGPDPLRGQAP